MAEPDKANNGAPEETQRAGVILYRRGNGFEFLLVKRHAGAAGAAATALWELPTGPLDARQEEPRLVAQRNTHLTAGIWPDCYLLHRDFVRVNVHLEDGRRVRETFYLAEIDKKTRGGDEIDSETLPRPSEQFSGFQWMSADLAKVRIKTDHGRLLLGQVTDFLESQDQIDSVFSALRNIK